jgi:uncharacterized membrane protein
MYEILCRPAERPLALDGRVESAHVESAHVDSSTLVLHMQENRSYLSEPSRQAFAALGMAMMALSILPALSGHWLVPVFSLMALGGLVLALESHARSQPKAELLEIVDGTIRHRDATGHATHLPCVFTRLHAEAPNPASLRLILRSPKSSVEVGRCLGLDERRALIPVIAAALAQGRG